MMMMMMELCAGCRLPIVDRFLLNVADRPWHEVCVQCSVCRSSLNERCFFREGKLFCRDDFYKNFGTKCAGCSHGISPNEMVRKSREKIFHLECFTCLICSRQLSTGEELFLNDDDTFVCKQDYACSKKVSDEQSCQRETPIVIPSERRQKDIVFDTRSPGPQLESGNSQQAETTEQEAKQEMENSDCESVVSNCSYYSSTPSAKISNNNNMVKVSDKLNDGEKVVEISTGVGAKRRGPRTTIKIKQLETLKAAFAATPKPTRNIREQLARDTGLSMRVIQVWFQNRRSKERRMKQLNILGTRRQFFRNPRRIRSFRPGDETVTVIDDSQLIPSSGFGYFSDGAAVEVYHPGFIGYSGYIDQISVPLPQEVPFLQPSTGSGRSIIGLSSEPLDASRTSTDVFHFGSSSSFHSLGATGLGATLAIQSSNISNGDVGLTPCVQHLEKPWTCL